jgi:hypothetical protein
MTIHVRRRVLLVVGLVALLTTVGWAGEGTLAVEEERPDELTEEVPSEVPEPRVPGPEVQGTWQGSIEMGAERVRLVLKMTRGDDGAWIGRLDSPDLGASGLLVDTVEIGQDSVRFRLSGVAAEFTGRLATDAMTIAGQWKQSGAEHPLTFRRTPR